MRLLNLHLRQLVHLLATERLVLLGRLQLFRPLDVPFELSETLAVFARGILLKLSLRIGCMPVELNVVVLQLIVLHILSHSMSKHTLTKHAGSLPR